MISLFGAGFIGGTYANLYKDEVFIEPRDSLTPKHDKILYLRSTVSNYNAFSNPSLDISTNLLLLTETLKNLTPNNELNFISSFFVYGKGLESLSKRETDYCNPKGLYAISKRTAEQIIDSYCLTMGISFKILRLSNIIGGDLKADGKKNALEFLIQKLKNNETVEIYSGDNYRNYLDVVTCCKAINYVMANGKKNEIYNIGSRQSEKLIDIIDYCKTKIQSKSEIKIVEAPAFHRQVQVNSFHMDTKKLRDLGFDNNIDLKLVLNRLCLT